MSMCSYNFNSFAQTNLHVRVENWIVSIACVVAQNQNQKYNVDTTLKLSEKFSNTNLLNSIKCLREYFDLLSLSFDIHMITTNDSNILYTIYDTYHFVKLICK